MNASQLKIFLFGAVLGAVFGATVLASIAHVILIGLAVAGAGAVVYRGRRLVLHRGENAEQLKG
jgi:hypothetical protein